MPKLKDITNQRFGRLVALVRLGRVGSGTKWLCRCDCGTTKPVYLMHLTRGLTQSCGCIKQEQRTKHGMAHTNLYRRWMAMRARCQNPKHKQFRDYGGRGIAICAEWGKFAPFAEWSMANGYAPHLELDRIDPNGDYSPQNCRWITHWANMQNMRRSTTICVHGANMTLSEASIRYGVNRNTIRWRLRIGETPDEAVDQNRNRRSAAQRDRVRAR